MILNRKIAASDSHIIALDTYTDASDTYRHALETHTISEEKPWNEEWMVAVISVRRQSALKGRGIMSSQSAVPSPKPSVLQLSLWSMIDDDKTNMVALYDLAPRFIYLTGEHSTEAHQKVIEREFTFGNKRYKITIKPTQIQKKSGKKKTIVDRYLGEREQIVEEVIRRIASNRNRLRLSDNNKLRFVFSLYEIREELIRINHSYNTDEISQAITILNEVRIRIEDLDDKSEPLLSAPVFPVMGMRRRGSTGDHDTFVEFNPMVAEAIKMMNFQQVSYEILMRIRDPIARWLMKRLHLQITASGEDIQLITAMEIHKNSGMANWKAKRNLLRRITQAVETLQQNGILELIETEEHTQNKRKTDITYTIKATSRFMEEVRYSNEVVEENISALTEEMSPENSDGGFVFISPAKERESMAKKKKLSAAKKAPQLELQSQQD